MMTEVGDEESFGALHQSKVNFKLKVMLKLKLTPQPPRQMYLLSSLLAFQLDIEPELISLRCYR